MGLEKYREKWGRRTGDPRPKRGTLADGRPDPPERNEPLACERCGADVDADRVACLWGGYWVCPDCARVFEGMVNKARRMGGHRD